MRVGAAHTVITPPPGIWLAGFAARRDPAIGVHDDLYARAMVFEDRGSRLGIVVCDLCELDAGFVAAVRERAEEQAGISAGALLVAATHTHAAPATFQLYSQPPDRAWLGEVVERTAGAVAQAAERLSVADLTVAVGQETTIARNRRRPHGPVDPTVTVLRAGRGALPAAYFLHYACHPTVLGPDNLLISRDYVGFAVDALARATGGWAMFANGACADINVGHSADRSALGLPIPGRTFERAEALGQRLAAEAGRALADARPAVVGEGQRRTLAANRRAVLVPLRPAPRPEDARRAVVSWRERVRALEQAGATLETQ
ncbi:MAG: neutral/alkaline non-lysosomal ceramidase N-terminal domain-containing protein, partial [Armatimonadota bacterium]|nr:neutral/alkaline non-lysosomal ceramidase N-terminal domain-containing protein [Armatimonadota bacterium]